MKNKNNEKGERKMKKLIGFLVIAVFVMVPLHAEAELLGWGDLNVSHSTPTDGGYYLDYDGTVISSSFGYTTGLEEVFCVSSQEGNGGLYDFYAITPDLGSIYSTLSQAAWIADNWTNWGTDDSAKGEAQKAIWKIMGVMDITGGAGTDWTIYNAAKFQTNYTTNNWYYAHSPSSVPDGIGIIDYQDFLTPVSVPEPATMLLLGFGLIGLAGFGRNKLFKKA
jgi:hypothetical protein